MPGAGCFRCPQPLEPRVAMPESSDGSNNVARPENPGRLTRSPLGAWRRVKDAGRTHVPSH